MLDFTFMVEFMENGNNNDLLLKTKYTLDGVVPCTQRTYEGIMATLVFFSYEKPNKISVADGFVHQGGAD